jgi:hypothetical protein
MYLTGIVTGLDFGDSGQEPIARALIPAALPQDLAPAPAPLAPALAPAPAPLAPALAPAPTAPTLALAPVTADAPPAAQKRSSTGAGVSDLAGKRQRKLSHKAAAARDP